MFAAVLRLLDYYSRKYGACQQKMKSFFEKKRKVNVRLQKAKTEAFHCGISTATDLFSTVKTIRSGKEKDLKPKFQVFLVEISGIEPLTS